jgi:hypothetical protein
LPRGVRCQNEPYEIGFSRNSPLVEEVHQFIETAKAQPITFVRYLFVAGQ